MTVEITDDDDLRRHINPIHYHEDGTISIAAYKTNNMSLDLCRLRTLDQSMAAHPGWGMTEFKALVPRGLGLTVVYSPVLNHPEYPDNPAHCEIPGRASDSKAKKLRDAARAVYTPPK